MLWARFKLLLRCLFDLVFPNQCVVCGENLAAHEEVLCLKCLSDIPRTGFHLECENVLERRFWGRAEVERATAFFYFRKGSHYRVLLHQLKYNNRQDVGRVLGRYAALELRESDDFCHFDYIVPVPLHPNKMRKRGYNQSECIADGLAEVLNVEVDTKVLVRSIENPTQTNKSVYERWENTNGIFSLTDRQRFEHKHILLVDDVLTTGSTLIACVQALKEVDCKVSIFTLASA